MVINMMSRICFYSYETCFKTFRFFVVKLKLKRHRWDALKYIWCIDVNNVTDTSGTSVLIQDPTANRCFILNPYKMWTCMTILSNLKKKFCTIIQTCVKTIPWKTFNFRNKNLHHEFDDIIKSSRDLALKKKQPT